MIPGLHVSKKHYGRLEVMAKACGDDVYGSAFEEVKTTSDIECTLVSIAFYAPEKSIEHELRVEVGNHGRLILERFLGALSFHTGLRFSAIEAQTAMAQPDGSYATHLEATSKSHPSKVALEIPEVPFNGRVPSQELFSAMFWLRRGLSSRDSLETYGALMVALQSIAREVVTIGTVEVRCRKCGERFERRPSSITSLVRALVVERLGKPVDLFERMWRARNAITAHGNAVVTASVFLELTELKYEAIELCFRGLKYALGMRVDEPPHAHQYVFVSSAMMYVD